VEGECVKSECSANDLWIFLISRIQVEEPFLNCNRIIRKKKMLKQIIAIACGFGLTVAIPVASDSTHGVLQLSNGGYVASVSPTADGGRAR
jgi:hypothetical protein